MMRTIALVAFAIAAASAQRWPMITVNSAGEIVLQSLTRAQSFQVTPVTITTAPTSSGTASLTTASALTAGVSAYVVTTATSPATGHGVTLPAPTAGAQVTLHQSQTTFTSYTIWSSASSVFINDDANTVSLTVYQRKIVCTAVSTTRWHCEAPIVGQSYGYLYQACGTGTTCTVTAPTPSQSGTVQHVSTASATASALTMTLYSCSSSNAGARHQILLSQITSATTSALTFTITTNLIVGAALTAKAATAGGTATSTGALAAASNVATAATTYAFTTATVNAVGNFVKIDLLCGGDGTWYSTALGLSTS